MTTSDKKAKRIIRELRALGFGTDEYINGGDCVDTMVKLFPDLQTICEAHDALVNALKLMQHAWDMPEKTERQRAARSKAWMASTDALEKVKK